MANHSPRLPPTAGRSTKSPQPLGAGALERGDWLRPVVANGLDRAAFLGFLATRFFLWRCRLFEDVRITAVFIALEIVRRSLAAQVTIYTLVIDKILARNIFRIFVCNVSHKVSYIGPAIWRPPPAMASSFRIFHSGC